MSAATLHTARLDLVPLTVEALEATVNGDRLACARALGVPIPLEWLDVAPFAELRLGPLREDPTLAPWGLRAVIVRETATLVGHVGFHDRPGNPALVDWAPEGVELGYTTFRAHRRRGYAREAVVALIEWAERSHGVCRFVASIAPTNRPSRALARSVGFALAGTTVDEVDGLEEVWVRTSSS